MEISLHQQVPSEIVVHPDFPRSSKYDPQWVFDNGMGWPVMWATEALAQQMDLQPGMRVLDLGCGKAMSALFLAKEFDVHVCATDLWISPTDNWRRIQTAGVADRVFPLSAEAHALPFAHGYFDAIVSLGTYHYFGTDDYYLDTIIQFLKPGGQIGIVSPGLIAEFGHDVPEHLTNLYRGGYDSWATFHSPDWWRWHWEKTRLVGIEMADLVPNGWQLWLQYDEIIAGLLANYNTADLEALRQDNGRHIGLPRIIARRLKP